MGLAFKGGVTVKRLRNVGLMVLLIGLGLTGCGQNGSSGQSQPSAQGQAAAVQGALPSTIADPPKHLDIPHWGARNPHFHVLSSGDQIRISSTDHGWNGQFVDLYFVPYANVKVEDGDYAVRDTASPQRIATARMKNDQTWSVTWNTKGHPLPQTFYILARTNTGQVNLERVIRSSGKYIDGGAESSLH